MQIQDPKQENEVEGDLGLPSLDWSIPEEQACPVSSAAKAAQREPDDLATCLQTIRQHHPHIGRALDALWGFAECEAYLQRLIQDGGDGQHNARHGFAKEVMQALLTAAEQHRVSKR